MTLAGCDPPPPYKATMAIDHDAHGNDKHPKPPDSVTLNVPVLPFEGIDTIGFLNYFAPQLCFASGIKIGTVLTDLDCPVEGKKYQIHDKLTPNEERHIFKPIYEFNITHNSGIINKMMSLFQRFHDIKRTFYHVEQLSIDECRVDEKLEETLRADQEIKDIIQSSSKKQAFFIYGTCWGEKVQITEQQSTHRGWRLDAWLKQAGVSFHRSTLKAQQSTIIKENAVFGFAVLNLTLKDGVLKAERFTTGAHF